MQFGTPLTTQCTFPLQTTLIFIFFNGTIYLCDFFEQKNGSSVLVSIHLRFKQRKYLDLSKAVFSTNTKKKTEKENRTNEEFQVSAMRAQKVKYMKITRQNKIILYAQRMMRFAWLNLNRICKLLPKQIILNQFGRKCSIIEWQLQLEWNLIAILI